MINRENILNALLTKVQAATGIKSAQRKLILWDQVSESQKPMLVLIQTSSRYNYTTRGTPAVLTIRCKLLVYVSVGQDVAIPASILNPILDAIDAALVPEAATGRQSLGGLVLDCRIEGDNVEDAGDLDGNGVSMRNIEIIVPVTGV